MPRGACPYGSSVRGLLEVGRHAHPRRLYFPSTTNIRGYLKAQAVLTEAWPAMSRCRPSEWAGHMATISTISTRWPGLTRLAHPTAGARKKCCILPEPLRHSGTENLFLLSGDCRRRRVLWSGVVGRARNRVAMVVATVPPAAPRDHKHAAAHHHQRRLLLPAGAHPPPLPRHLLH